MTAILEFDHAVFELINSAWQNPFFDQLMPLLRERRIWLPLYLFFLSFLVINFRRSGWYLVLAIALTAGAADLTSSHLIKKSVQRPRPCKALEQHPDMRLLVTCGSGYSFPSSHATNHFCLATFLGLVLGRIRRWVWAPLLAWAAFIAFAQVYVGVHYPLDVVAGAFLGMSIGWLGYQAHAWLVSALRLPASVKRKPGDA